MTRTRKRRPVFGQVGGRPATVSQGGVPAPYSEAPSGIEAAENDSEADSSHDSEPSALEIPDNGGPHPGSEGEAEHIQPIAAERTPGAAAADDEIEAEGDLNVAAPQSESLGKRAGTQSAAPYLHQPASSNAGFTQPPAGQPVRGKRRVGVVLGAVVALAAAAAAGFWFLGPLSDTTTPAAPEAASLAVPLPSSVVAPTGAPPSVAPVAAPTPGPSAASIAEAKRAERTRASGLLALAEQLRRGVESGAPVGQTIDAIAATGALPAPVDQAIAQLRPLSQGVATLGALSQSFQVLADQAEAQSALAEPWLTRAFAKLTATFGGGPFNPLQGTVARLRSTIEDGRTSEVADWLSQSQWAAFGTDWIGQARARASALTAAQTITEHAQQAYSAAAAAAEGL